MKVNHKILKLFANRGFYILLALGIGIVGVTGYVTNLRNKDRHEIPLSTVSEPQPPEPKNTPDKPMALKAEESEQSDDTFAAPIVASARQELEPFRLMLPLQGELGMGFSGDELVYNKTMRDWRIHSGIDIRADAGTPVKAAADGIVTKAYNDEMMGFTVEILHADGIETIYSNMQTGQLVEENAEVKKGDVIGGAGTTAAYEINDPPHLHFEVKKDGIHVNPFGYIM